MDKKKILEEINNFQGTHLNKIYENLSFYIILIQPESYGNIGSIARVMKNFNFQELIIFNPIESVDNILSYEAQGFAMHGKEILLNAKIIEVNKQEDHVPELLDLLQKFDLVIATTAKGKSYTNLNRISLFPEDLELPISKKSLKIALLFGKESRGLTNEELELADISLRIPANAEYSTLNLSHACGIILYEIFKKLNIITIGRGKSPVLLADREDRAILYSLIKNLTEKLKIRNYKKNNVLIAFKNVFERSMMSRKELSMILGLFSKTYSILKNKELFEEED